MVIGAVLYAKDVDRVAAFYTGLTGMVATHTEDDHVRLAAAHFELVILAMPEPLASTVDISTPPQRRTDTPVKLVFAVPDLAATRVAAPGLGGELNPADREWSYGDTVVCDGADPEGNVVQFRQPA
jgi:predicted enzyme related to lactoylglutathione lyase